MNTRFLATLCAVAETGSLAGAARVVQLSSAAVAEQVQALERELGVRLIKRHGRGVVLTNEGSAVVNAGRDILVRVADLAQVVQLGRLRGELRVGSVSTALISIVPPALKFMSRQHPYISLNIIPGTSSQLNRMLDLGEIDCAITVKPDFDLAKGFGWHPLRAEPLVLVSPCDIDCDDIQGFFSRAPIIRMNRRSPTGQIVTKFLIDKKVNFRETFEMEAADTIVMLVSLGLGISLLPDYGFRSSVDRPIRTIKIQEEAYHRQIGILYRIGPRDALIGALFESFSTCFE